MLAFKSKVQALTRKSRSEEDSLEDPSEKPLRRRSIPVSVSLGRIYKRVIRRESAPRPFTEEGDVPYPVSPPTPPRRLYSEYSLHLGLSKQPMQPMASDRKNSSAVSESNSLSPEAEKPASLENEEKYLEIRKPQDDRRPSFAELQKEDRVRRPSVNVYQSVDVDHPDIIHIQALVEKMKFGEDY